MEEKLKNEYDMFLTSLLSMSIDEFIDSKVLSFEEYKCNYLEEKEN